MSQPTPQHHATDTLTSLPVQSDTSREQRDGCTCDCGNCPCGPGERENKEEANDAR